MANTKEKKNAITKEVKTEVVNGKAIEKTTTIENGKVVEIREEVKENIFPSVDITSLFSDFKGKEIVFNDRNGNDIVIDYSMVHDFEKEIVEKYFDSFANETSFHVACMTGKWLAPKIGLHDKDEMHEKEYMTLFFESKNINWKKFINAKFTPEELKELSATQKDVLKVCNSFLNNIAIDGEKVDVSMVKETLNKFNDDVLKINLVCMNDNDEPYTLTATNKMVRIKLIDSAKENNDISGFKKIKIVDLINVIVSGLSKTYVARSKQD